MVAVAEAHEQALAEVLSKDQLQRFRQIGLQSQGIFAFKDPEIVKSLKLTREQRADIRQIERGMFGRRLVFMNPPLRGAGPPERIERPKPDAWIGPVMELLTEAQRQRWQELSGEPFAGLGELGFVGPGPFGGPHPEFTPPRMNRERP
jgi:hypothetical protein